MMLSELLWKDVYHAVFYVIGNDSPFTAEQVEAAIYGRGLKYPDPRRSEIEGCLEGLEQLGRIRRQPEDGRWISTGHEVARRDYLTARELVAARGLRRRLTNQARKLRALEREAIGLRQRAYLAETALARQVDKEQLDKFPDEAKRGPGAYKPDGTRR